MIEDCPELSEEVDLQYAASTRNCCLYVHGFAPAQLAIRQSPILPSAFNDKLPSLERKTISPAIAKHLNTIATTRKAFANTESSAKLRKALNHPVSLFMDRIVYFTRCLTNTAGRDQQQLLVLTIKSS